MMDQSYLYKRTASGLNSIFRECAGLAAIVLIFQLLPFFIRKIFFLGPLWLFFPIILVVIAIILLILGVIGRIRLISSVPNGLENTKPLILGCLILNLCSWVLLFLAFKWKIPYVGKIAPLCNPISFILLFLYLKRLSEQIQNFELEASAQKALSVSMAILIYSLITNVVTIPYITGYALFITFCILFYYGEALSKAVKAIELQAKLE